MKTLLISILILLNTFTGIAKGFKKIYGCFNYLNVTKYTDCFLNLYKDGKYDLVFDTQETNDIVFTSIISIGYYTQKDNIINLKDTFTGSDMRFTYNKNSLIGTQTFKFLLGRKLVLSEFNLDKKSIFNFKDFGSVQDAKLLQNKLNLNRYIFLNGDYCDFNALKVSINANKTYSLIYKTIQISRGTWERNRNQIIMFDSFMKNYFYAFIDKDKLDFKFSPFGKKSLLAMCQPICPICIYNN